MSTPLYIICPTCNGQGVVNSLACPRCMVICVVEAGPTLEQIERLGWKPEVKQVTEKPFGKISESQFG